MSDDKTVDQVTRVLAEHQLSEPQGGVNTRAWCECSCGSQLETVGGTRGHAMRLARRHIARALADEGLITPATLRKEFILRRGDDEPSHFRWVSDLEPSTTHRKERGMSTSKKFIEVTMKPATEYGEIGGLPGNTVTIEGDEFYADGERNLIITDDDNEEVAIFASGEWRFARRVMDPNHIE